MKRAEGGRSRGYTIFETMIFLAVSGAMFVSAAAFINGRQSRTEFSSSVRDFESSMNDLASDVSTGYYDSGAADGGRLQCQGVPGGPGGVGVVNAQVGAGGKARGTNQGCIFIGKSIQFAPSGNKDEYATISLAGLQYKEGKLSGEAVKNLDESTLRPLISTNDSSNPGDSTLGLPTIKPMGGGVTIECVFYALTIPDVDEEPCRTAGTTKIDVLTFLTTYQPYNFQRAGGADSSRVNMIVPKTTPVSVLNRNSANAGAELRTYRQDTTEPNPKGGVFVCLRSNGSDQHALITLGGQNSRFSVRSSIATGGCGA